VEPRRKKKSNINSKIMAIIFQSFFRSFYARAILWQLQELNRCMVVCQKYMWWFFAYEHFSEICRKNSAAIILLSHFCRFYAQEIFRNLWEGDSNNGLFYVDNKYRPVPLETHLIRIKGKSTMHTCLKWKKCVFKKWRNLYWQAINAWFLYTQGKIPLLLPLIEIALLKNLVEVFEVSIMQACYIKTEISLKNYFLKAT